MSQIPVISVGMPVYNGEGYLEAAIRAVLEQTFDDFELIISDNASTDRTAEICNDFAASDSRVRFSRNPDNIGAAANYNRVFELARGPYFRWMNADDSCMPTLHALCLKALEENRDAVLAYGKTAIMDQEGKILEAYDDNLDLRQPTAKERYQEFFAGVGLTNAIYGLMRTAVVASTGRMRNGSFPAADINFMAELTLYGKFIELPEQLFYRRMHPQSSSWQRDDDEIQQTFWTGQGDSFRWPNWKKYLDHMQAVRHAPLGQVEKLSLQGHLLRRMMWSRQALLQDIFLEFRRLGGQS